MEEHPATVGVLDQTTGQPDPDRLARHQHQRGIRGHDGPHPTPQIRSPSHTNYGKPEADPQASGEEETLVKNQTATPTPSTMSGVLHTV